MKRIYIYFIFPALLTAALAVCCEASGVVTQSARTITLGKTPVKVNIYERSGANLTFVAPHFDEATGARLVKESIAENGGRLVEIESRNAAGKPYRYLTFSFQGINHRIDPNRIFTANGRRCAGLPEAASAVVDRFAQEFLGIILAPGAALREGESFLAAVHNNVDVSGKPLETKNIDLTAYAFVRYDKFAHPSRGAFEKQAEGVYLSNLEEDEDNFIFLSTPIFISYFAAKGFNVVVQKPASKLLSADCGVDDGSLSVFAGQQNVPYINIEADARTGSSRQRQMIESVYELSKQTYAAKASALRAVAEK